MLCDGTFSIGINIQPKKKKKKMGNVNESGKRISFWLLFQISLDVYFTCLCKIEYSCIVGKYTFASSVARLIDKFAPLVVTMLIHCHISLLLDMKAIFLRRILEISCVKNLFFGGGGQEGLRYLCQDFSLQFK